MKALKEQIQAKLAEKRLQKAQIKYSEPPRYDDVFFQGVKWLDNLAEDPVPNKRGKWFPFCLSEEDLIILDGWLLWLIEGSFPEDGILGMYRAGLKDLDIGR
ncbi:MAG: hypothetical protein HY787_00410 [Deltaproteobacteria bacterium]|nr:hypothetical protein [Deltaproteobacteria bacterium]